jgi:hypothetical protein
MKYLGKHEFSGLADINEGKIFNADILNKLSIPLHKDISEPSFGDIFTENNSVNFVDNEGDINLLLDLKNDDIVKALITSELVFDNFFNYGEEYNVSNSFHSKVDIESSDFIQNNISINTECVLYSDTTSNFNVLEFNLNSEASVSALIGDIAEFISAKLPLNTILTDTTTGLTSTNMIKFTSISSDTTTVYMRFDIDEYST